MFLLDRNVVSKLTKRDPDPRVVQRFETQVLPWLSVLEFDLIAAAAKAHGLILVTRNVKHFDHVAGLQVENWFE